MKKESGGAGCFRGTGLWWGGFQAKDVTCLGFQSREDVACLGTGGRNPGGAEKAAGMEGKNKTSDLRGQESDTAGPRRRHPRMQISSYCQKG